MRLLSVGDGSEGKVVGCGEVEREVFGGRDGGTGIEEDEGMKAYVGNDDDDNDDDESGGVPLPSSSTSTAITSALPTTQADGNGEGLSSQQRGIRKAKEREMVRQAARRGVAFGFEIEGSRRKVDCVREGRVVESSFAKGEWGVRWRG